MSPRKLFGRPSDRPARPTPARVEAEVALLGNFVLESLASSVPVAELNAFVAFLTAPHPRALLAVVRANPWLASPRGQAFLGHAAFAVASLGMDGAALVVADRSAWLDLLVEIELQPGRLVLPDG